MKCRICASECPPGAKICRDCAAARKRAFAATVTQPLLAAVGAPSVSQARFAPRPVRPRAASKPSATRPEAASARSVSERSKATSTRGGIRIKWLLLGAALVIAVVIIMIKLIASGNPHASDASAGQEAGTDSTAPSTPGEAAKTPFGNLQQNERRGAPTARISEPDEVAPRKAAKAAARKPPTPVEAPVLVPSEAPAAPKAEPVAAAPRAPAPRVVEAPRDPLQAMNEGLARCAREDFFSRAGCEQKLRLQYCGNYWGTVPQCPIGPATDHGQ